MDFLNFLTWKRMILWQKPKHGKLFHAITSFCAIRSHKKLLCHHQKELLYCRQTSIWNCKRVFYCRCHHRSSWWLDFELHYPTSIEACLFKHPFYKGSHSKGMKERALHVHQRKTKHFIAKLLAQPYRLLHTFSILVVVGKNWVFN